MKVPEVSVVMSVFNGADVLPATLQSILDQQGCEFEFIVVNDGSTDATGQLLDEWAERDARLRVVHQDNTGLTRALMRGCAEARGAFIARQDCGDVSLPGRLAGQVAALRCDDSLAFVSCPTRYVEADGEYLYSNRGTGAAARPLDIIDIRQRHGVVDGPSHHGSVMFRKCRYVEAGGYRAEFYFGQDWDLWYRLARKGTFQMLSETLYEARIGVGDISTSNKPMQEALAKLSLAALRLQHAGKSDAEVLAQASQLRPQGGQKRLRGVVSGGCYFLGECLRRNGSLPKARDYFRRAVQDDPTNVRAWLRLAQITLTWRSLRQPS